MPKEERKKGTHLTWDDRHEIQKGLKEHRTFKEIAYIIGCSPDTVSKEIRRHRYHKLRNRDGILHASPNRCKYRNSCRRWDVCKRRRDISAEFHAGSVSAAISCVLTLWMHHAQ